MRLKLVILTLLWHTQVYATAILEPPPEGTAPKPIEKVHKVIQKSVHNLADSLDHFFSNQKYTEEEQKSSLKIRSTLSYARGGEMDFKMSVRGNLSLPRVEERWQIFVSRLSERDEDELADERDVIINRQLQEEDTIFGLQYTFYSKLLRHLKIRLGPRIRDGKVKAYLATRARFTYDYINWLFTVTETIYFDNDQFGEKTNLDLERKLAPKVLLSWDNSITFSESSEGLDLGSIAAIRQFINARSASGVSLGFAAHTHPKAVVDSYYFALHYRQRLGWDWLFLDVRPEARYPREADYHYSPILFITLESQF